MDRPGDLAASRNAGRTPSSARDPLVRLRRPTRASAADQGVRPTKSSRAAKLLCLVAFSSGCGYVGDPLPPSLDIPVAVKDLAVAERGDTLVIEFTAPAETTDAVPLRRLGEVDLRAGPEGPEWESQATRIDAPAVEPGRVRIEAPVRGLAGRDLVFRVRVAGRKGRFSEWSNAVRMRVVPPLEPPRDVRAEAVSEGVRVSWNAPPGASFRVYRRGAKETEPALVGTSDTNAYTDAGTGYGTAYEYSVEAFLKTGDSEASSERSATAAVTPVDRFAPAIPSGLTATPGAAAIQLTWNPNTEPDLRGYALYRSAAGGPFERVGEPLPTPYFADRSVQSGTSYRYSVSAVDQTGNESERTPPAEATAP